MTTAGMVEWTPQDHLRRATELLEVADQAWTDTHADTDLPLGLMLANTHIEMAQAKRSIGAIGTLR